MKVEISVFRLLIQCMIDNQAYYSSIVQFTAQVYVSVWMLKLKLKML